jgi:hypothetical protein
MPPTIPCGLAAFAVAAIFYVYRAYEEQVRAHQRKLRERVTYMLWVMANLAHE